MYVIDMSNLNVCDNEALEIGLLPVTTTSPDMTSLVCTYYEKY